jgi:hypothetical protein
MGHSPLGNQYTLEPVGIRVKSTCCVKNPEILRNLALFLVFGISAEKYPTNVRLLCKRTEWPQRKKVEALLRPFNST